MQNPSGRQIGSLLPAGRSALRGILAAAGLFLATAAVILWQNAHVAVLFDLSYILNTATRIALGQMPYRDFPLPHAPLTFLIQAVIIRLTGRVFFHHVLYVALMGGLGTVLTWRMALAELRGRVKAAWSIALMLAAPLTVLGIYCIVPNPEYDCDCGFWILAAIGALARVDRKKSAASGFLAGAMLCVPLFFKQNMGLPLLLAGVAAVLAILAVRTMQGSRETQNAPGSRALLALLAGVFVALLAAVLALHWTVGLGNYLLWTIHYAGQRRLPGLGLMLGVYRDPLLLGTVPCVLCGLLLLRFGGRGESHPGGCVPPRRIAGMGRQLWVRIAAFSLIAAPFLFALSSLWIYDDADERSDSLLALWPLLLVLGAALATAKLFRLRHQISLRPFMPLILLAAIHGTFLSQQLWGSTYGIWPLLVLLIAELIVCLDTIAPRQAAARWFVPALAAVISGTLLVCGAFYTASEERLSYANLPDGPPAHSAYPELAGLATPGPYLPAIDELLRYAQANIPWNDGIVLIPGEEPFYFASGRAQQFPVAFFDPTIDPYSPAEIASLVRSRNIRWLIVKTDVQTKEDPALDRAAILDLLMREFTPAAHLRGYDIYRRR